MGEIISYLEARNAKFDLEYFSKEFFAINTDPGFGSNIEDLGGTIKIGEAKAKFPTEIVKESFHDKNKQAQAQITQSLATSSIVDEMAKSEEKMLFGVSVYCSEKTLRQLSSVIQRFVGSTIKNELTDCGKKSKFMGFSKDRRLAQLSHVEVLKKNLVENKSEVLFCIGKDDTWVAVTIAVHNPFEFQKRDIYKPNQRKIFAMPPRLARIIVNLSACTPGKVFLDPFCGVGTVLQEALLARASVIGVDVNAWCVKAASENLQWLKNEYSMQDVEFRVVQGDVGRLAEKVGQDMVDCIATEPDLGPALRQIPTVPYAQKIIEKLRPLYFGFVEQAYRVLKQNGRLVLVTPYIVSRSGQQITMPIDERAESCGFRLVQPFEKQNFSKAGSRAEELVGLRSLIEADERHKISREIHIYQK